MPWAASKPPKHLEALKLATSSGRGAVTASFSRHRGSLTQFRMYSPAAGGYAIGFPTSYLEQMVAGVNAKHPEVGLGPEAGLLDCEYALAQKEEWCQRFARQFLDLAAAADNVNMSPQDLYSAVMGQSDLYRRWIVARLRFKSDEFRAEDEVRFYCIAARSWGMRGHSSIDSCPTSDLYRRLFGFRAECPESGANQALRGHNRSFVNAVWPLDSCRSDWLVRLGCQPRKDPRPFH